MSARTSTTWPAATPKNSATPLSSRNFSLPVWKTRTRAPETSWSMSLSAVTMTTSKPAASALAGERADDVVGLVSGQLEDRDSVGLAGAADLRDLRSAGRPPWRPGWPCSRRTPRGGSCSAAGPRRRPGGPGSDAPGASSGASSRSRRRRWSGGRPRSRDAGSRGKPGECWTSRPRGRWSGALRASSRILWRGAKARSDDPETRPFGAGAGDSVPVPGSAGGVVWKRANRNSLNRLRPNRWGVKKKSRDPFPESRDSIYVVYEIASNLSREIFESWRACHDRS